jgi:hypothetical protein
MSLSDLVENNADRLHQKKNVVGVAVGKKWSNGQPTDQDAILVLVEKKEALSSLKASDIIETQIDGIPTDVVGKVGRLRKLAYTKKERPINSGISCGHLSITAGTVGGVFYDREGSLVVLSNNHVLANENKAKRGNLAVQPGPYDGGTSGDRFGTLKYYRPLARTTDQSFDAYRWMPIYGYNVEDSATALIDSPDLVTDIIKDIGSINGFRDNVAINETVQKTGRTTQYTTGNVIGLNAETWVRYDMGSLKFKDCIITSNMSQGGDSGSLLLDMQRNAVGLLFAGSDTVTIHNPIKYPRTTYGLSIYQARAVVEQYEFIVKHNGVVVSHNYIGAADMKRAVEEAYAKSKRDGTTVEVLINYKAAPK